MGATLQMTPTSDWIDSAVRSCRQRLLVASPFVGDPLARWMESVGRGVRKVLVTRLDVLAFARGSSDLAAVQRAARAGAQVLCAPLLHAKAYVVDRDQALVTSANATRAGMYHNRECGVALHGRAVVEQVASAALAGFSDGDPPQPWSRHALDGLSGPVLRARRLVRAVQTIEREALTESRSQGQAVARAHLAEFATYLTGWQRLVMECILELPDEFALGQAYDAVLPRAAREYPSNHHPEAKVRQQLQILRDLGPIDFVAPGHYRFAWRSPLAEGGE